MNNWIHLNQKCPTTSSSRDILFRTLHFVWTTVLQDGSVGGKTLYIRVLSKEKPFLADDGPTCQYRAVFRQQFRTIYRSQVLVLQRMHHHVVHHRLWTLLRCVDHQFYQQCEDRCEITIRENSLHLRSTCMHLKVFQHDFQHHHANTTPKKQPRKPWRHNETKRSGSLGRTYILPLSERSKRVMLLYDAYKLLVVDQ